MNRKTTIVVLLLLLLLMGGAGAAAAVYLRADHREPELTLRTDVVTEYGQDLSMYELIDRVEDESDFSLTVNCPQGTLTPDGKGVTFPGVGSYQVELTARDEHGNFTTQSTVVQVVDTTPPELTAEEFTAFVGKELNYLEHVSAQDAVDGDISAAVQCSAARVDLNKPGRYAINYSVTDRAGNTATLSSYVTVAYPPAKKITLNEEEVWLSGNEYIQLKAKVKPSDWHGSVEWESSQPEVAEVSDGLVVWKGVGECVITATAGEKSASCKLHCEPPAATEVRLSKHRLTLEENTSVTLSAQVLPSNWTGTVEWVSSDPAVAIVDQEGNVTWISSGTCTITASAGEQSDECKVTCNRRSVQGLLEEILGLTEEDKKRYGGHTPSMLAQ